MFSGTMGGSRAGWDDLNRKPRMEPMCCCYQGSLKSFLETARVGPG